MSTPIVIEQSYNAPVERVWQALTDKDQMKQWYFKLDAFEPKVGFRFSFPGQGHKGEQYTHLCEITEVIPNRKLQYSWRYENYEGSSLLTFELFEEGKGTRLRLTHEGLESFPKHPDFARESFLGGWTQLVTELLRKFVEN